ncbi:MAG: FadR family transcriptional regulator [Myxococcales bacterium]|nr:FadR family transcriptional regulator [Myxococcales bacterium]
MTLRPVARASLSDHVFEQLTTEIVEGRFEPGSQLPSERALCEALQVNRGAIREAVKRLAQAGLVDSQHGSGHHVLDYRRSAGLDLLPRLLFRADGDVDLRVVRGVMEMRLAVGPDAAGRCAKRADAGCHAALNALVSQMEAAADDTETLQDLAVQFWDRIVDGSDNIAYRLAYNAMSEVYSLVRPALIEILAPEIRDVARCRQIAEAVSAHNEPLATEIARALLAKGTTALSDAMDALDFTEAP